MRAEMVLARKITGQKMEEIAAEFNISRATAYRALSQARREGMYEQAKDWVMTRLLPKALAVYDNALDNMDTEIARDVLQGLGIVGRHVHIVTKQVDPAEDFDEWRLKKAKAIDAQVVVNPDDQRDSTTYQTGAAESSPDVSGAGGDGDGPPAESAGEAPRGEGAGE